jgi:hypothetical protein
MCSVSETREPVHMGQTGVDNQRHAGNEENVGIPMHSRQI